MFPDEAVFGRCAEFRLETEPGDALSGRQYFLSTSDGSRVATDRVGSMIWESLPGNLRDIRTRLAADRESGAGVELSEKMLAEFLFLMIRAGIAMPDAAEPAEQLTPFNSSVGVHSAIPAAHPSSSVPDFTPPVGFHSSAPTEYPLSPESIAGSPQLAPAEIPSPAVPSTGFHPSASTEHPLSTGPIAGSPASAPIEPPLPIEPSEAPCRAALVSVIIVTYNSSAHIRACLSSLAVQTVAPLDIHVVDNGSTDDTLAIVARESQVIVHRLRRNRYYPGGINYGIRNSSGASFSSSTTTLNLPPRAWPKCVRVIEAAPKAAAVAPMLKFFRLRGFLNGIGNHVRPTGWGSDNFIGCVDVGQFADLVEVPSACVSAVLLRRSAVDDVGLFDASFRAFYEHPDWCFRARLGAGRSRPRPGPSFTTSSTPIGAAGRPASAGPPATGSASSSKISGAACFGLSSALMSRRTR